MVVKMTLKKCTCGQINTTKTAKFIGSTYFKGKILWFNCFKCRSTFVLRALKTSLQPLPTN